MAFWITNNLTERYIFSTLSDANIEFPLVIFSFSRLFFMSGLGDSEVVEVDFINVEYRF